jgi:hypothetical protein
VQFGHFAYLKVRRLRARRLSAVADYLAVIGDIRRSREARERADVQRRLEAGLERVNIDMSDALAAGFVVTLGDEFQGLVARAGTGLAVLLRLEDELRGIPIRYGLGWGGLTTELRERALGMDGPCFHGAREAIEQGKHDDRWVTVRGFGEEDAVLNGILRLVGEIRAGWTQIQAKTVSEARGVKTQKDVASSRGVSPSTVSQALKSAHYDAILEAERAAEAIMARFDRGGGGAGA